MHSQTLTQFVSLRMLVKPASCSLLSIRGSSQLTLSGAWLYRMRPAAGERLIHFCVFGIELLFTAPPAYCPTMTSRRLH